MNILIAYGTRYGYTARQARLLADRIGPTAQSLDLKRAGRLTLQPYGTVLIGGSVYGGTIRREVISFCEARREELLTRRVGLFLCCLHRGGKAEEQMAASFPPWLLTHAFGPVSYTHLTLPTN